MDNKESNLSSQRCKILIADDDLIFRTVASELVRSWGYDSVEVENGNAALSALLQERPPTIAILDWLMPGLTGPEICRQVRSGDARQYIYFILVSARDGREDSLEGLRSGADSYISKPLDAEELRTKLEIARRIVTMEESLRDLHAETELFINSVPSILIATDTQGKVTRWNKAAERVFGVNQDDANHPADDFRTWWQGAGIQERVEEALRTGTSTQQNLPFRRNHEQRLAGLKIHPLKSHLGTTLGSVITGADITENRIIEDQLRQTQKLEAIGQLAAGIAHEINTPAQFVGDNLKFLKEYWPALGELLAGVQKVCTAGLVPAELEAIIPKLDLEYSLQEIPQAINAALDGLQRIQKIVRAMKDFSHPGSAHQQPTDLNAAIQTTITVSRSEWKYVADLDTDLDPNLPLVPCVIDRFNQAILNIIVNAAHAVGEVVGDGSQGKGRIVVRTLRDGDWAEISISDTGKGVPEPIRQRIFEPFFTTKQVGKGTGQGLALAHSTIVKEHKGRLWCESAPSRGTTFFIRLPLAVRTQDPG